MPPREMEDQYISGNLCYPYTEVLAIWRVLCDAEAEILMCLSISISPFSHEASPYGNGVSSPIIYGGAV